MSTKHLLAISLALPIFAMSASAYAGVTISDKRYWPNEARSGTRRVAPRVQYLPGSRARQRKCRSRGKCGTTSVLRRLDNR